MATVRRESQEEVWARVEREGRRAEVQAVRNSLLTSGLTKRKGQAELVARFQPVDGSQTRAWPTPDSWACGRKDARKPPLDRQEQLERDIQWVHDHLERKPDNGPTPGAHLLLQMARERPNEFLKLYLKCVPHMARRQREQLEARRQSVTKRRDAARRRQNADKRAAYREKERRRTYRDAAQEEARRHLARGPGSASS